MKSSASARFERATPFGSVTAPKRTELISGTAGGVPAQAASPASPIAAMRRVRILRLSARTSGTAWRVRSGRRVAGR